MTGSPRFSEPDLDALRRAKILGVRSGAGHRFTGVWVVDLKGRVFVRSWNDKPTGWYRAFRKEPAGALYVDKRAIAIRAVPVGSVRLRRLVTAAYAEKYPTKASEKWVRGFAEPEREATTLELLPAPR